MKQFIAVILAVLLVLCGAFLTFALAEDAWFGSADMPPVNLTGVIVAVLALVFDFLLAWIAKVIIPPIKQWLATHTTEKQRGLMWDAVCRLVDAAEQIIRGPALGERRMAYVEAGLRQRGYTIDRDLIEAAVKQMKDRTVNVAGEAFGVTPLDLDENGEVDLDITHWSLSQLQTFFKLNNFDDTGFTTREEYVDYLSNPPVNG